MAPSLVFLSGTDPCYSLELLKVKQFSNLMFCLLFGTIANFLIGSYQKLPSSIVEALLQQMSSFL
jgi:hypothetical protein